MRKRMLLFAMVIACAAASAQNSEFTIHDNGLIYDEATMARLGSIVDSLNLRFKACEPQAYLAAAQGFAQRFSLDRHDADAIRALKNNITPEAFLEQFPDTRKLDRSWITKTYFTYGDKREIGYASLPLRKDARRFTIRLDDKRANDKTTGWVYRKRDGDDGLIMLYLEGLEEIPLPNDYARLVQYVDCMIDTTARIFLTDENDLGRSELPPDSKITQYLNWADSFKDRPGEPDIDWDSPFAGAQYEKFARELQQWNNRRLAWLDERMGEHYYKSLLMEATDEAIENRIGDRGLEFYVERYLSPSQALHMKRLRRPVGTCSMDLTPRFHAQQICRLAAETTQWDIFLRAHLDIMNDNFERMSDGSYAWAGRGTYLKELEELDINAADLLVGTCLFASNVSENHYFGNIPRIGRALAESNDQSSLEERLLAMIKDGNLDPYNRLRIAYLFEYYNYHLTDERQKNENAERFKEALNTLPMEMGKNFEE